MYQSKMHEINQQLVALTKAKLNLAEKINRMVQNREEDNK